MTMRPQTLPPGAVLYKTVGPFDADSLPDGLKRAHRLKAGAWGLLTLQKGEIAFVWDDADGGEILLSAPATIVVPPEIPHHLRLAGPFRLSIGFHRTG